MTKLTTLRLLIISLASVLLIAGVAESRRGGGLKPTGQVASADSSSPVRSSANNDRDYFDIRFGRKASIVHPNSKMRRAVTRAEKRLTQERLVISPFTGTLSSFTRWEGHLSTPSKGDIERVALTWLIEHRDLIGISKNDFLTLGTLNKVKAPNGDISLQWQQAYKGIPAFDGKLSISITRKGEVQSVGGSPIKGLRVSNLTPQLSPSEALKIAARYANSSINPQRISGPRGKTKLTEFAGDHSASLVLFNLGDRTRLAWRIFVYPPASDASYEIVIDARTGARLYQANIVAAKNRALVYNNYPGAAIGGTPQLVDLSQWLDPDEKRLIGPAVHVYADIKGTRKEEGTPNLCADVNSETICPEITPDTAGDYIFPRIPIDSPQGNCPSNETVKCTWDPWTPYSWTRNMKYVATQTFYFINRVKEFLAQDHINLVWRGSNFTKEREVVIDEETDAFLNSLLASLQTKSDSISAPGASYTVTKSARPTVRVLIGQASDPNTNIPGAPNYLFWNVAETDSSRSTITFGLDLPHPFPIPLLALPARPNKPAVSETESAETVGHEYSHLILEGPEVGLNIANGTMPGAMNEALADWWGTSFKLWLNPRPIGDEFKVGQIFNEWSGNYKERTQPFDCPVGENVPRCDRSGANPKLPSIGGYTLSDYGRISIGGNGNPSPEVHADGEILVETLFDLRRALIVHYLSSGEASPTAAVQKGIKESESLTAIATKSLSNKKSEDLTFLDFRDGILGANQARPAIEKIIWKVFAQRGMGTKASVIDDPLHGGITVHADFTQPAK